MCEINNFINAFWAASTHNVRITTQYLQIEVLNVNKVLVSQITKWSRQQGMCFGPVLMNSITGVNLYSWPKYAYWPLYLGSVNLYTPHWALATMHCILAALRKFNRIDYFNVRSIFWIDLWNSRRPMRWITWLLMPRPLTSAGHQQPWHLRLSSIRMNLRYANTYLLHTLQHTKRYLKR